MLKLETAKDTAWSCTRLEENLLITCCVFVGPGNIVVINAMLPLGFGLLLILALHQLIYNLQVNIQISWKFKLTTTTLTSKQFKLCRNTLKWKFIHDFQAASHIEILCAYDIKDIHDSQYQGPGAERVFTAFRRGRENKDPLDISQRNHTIADIVKWIFNSGEITRGYFALLNNCHYFAERLYFRLAEPTWALNPA